VLSGSIAACQAHNLWCNFPAPPPADVCLDSHGTLRPGQNSRIQGITMSLGYIYRIVSCRTCDSPIDVEYLGTTLSVRIAGTVTNPGQLRCPACGESHKYSGRDMKFWIKDHPPGRTR
jgi:RNase P subunit RPR2